MDAMAAFWSLFVEEETNRVAKRCVVVDMYKAKSELLLLQGLLSGPTSSSKSTTCTTADQDHDDCAVQVLGLKAGGFIGGFSGREDPEEPKPAEEHPVKETAAAVAAI